MILLLLLIGDRDAFFWRETILVTSNWIKIKKQKKAREKRRRNLRNLSEESFQRPVSCDHIAGSSLKLLELSIIAQHIFNDR